MTFCRKEQEKGSGKELMRRKIKHKMVSLDTSSSKSGYAYFENGELVDSGVISHEQEKDAEIRIVSNDL